MFSTMFAYAVLITTKVSDNWYGLEVKGQCHIYLNFSTTCGANFSFVFFG